MFEVTLGARTLDSEGFVRDFGDLRREVLQPTHLLLDHSLAIGPDTWRETAGNFESLGNILVDSRRETMGDRGERQPGYDGVLGRARNEFPGDIKIAVFPFSPTSERFAEWLFEVASDTMENERVKVLGTRVYEALHPVPTFAEWIPE
jgi:6-pyruvoyl-tetrahydropterin synthase